MVVHLPHIAELHHKRNRGNRERNVDLSHQALTSPPFPPRKAVEPDSVQPTIKTWSVLLAPHKTLLNLFRFKTDLLLHSVDNLLQKLDALRSRAESLERAIALRGVSCFLNNVVDCEYYKSKCWIRQITATTGDMWQQ